MPVWMDIGVWTPYFEQVETLIAREGLSKERSTEKIEMARTSRKAKIGLLWDARA